MRKNSVVTAVLLLEILALALVFLQLQGGVRTDEAKYLLSIPYPHPPLLRSLMAWTSMLPFHEFFWRFFIASLAVQSVWMISDLGDVLSRPRKQCLCAAWLLSSAVLLQGGTIMLSVFSGFFGLIFLWCALHPEVPRRPWLLACLWMASLFTAYQSILFAPLVLAAFLRSSLSRRTTILLFLLPIILLALYTLSNPLILVSMSHASLQDAPLLIIERMTRIGWIWILSGSLILSVVGTVGVLISNRLDLVATFSLIFGYVVLTSQHYYAILLTPVLIGGTYMLLCRRRLSPGMFIVSEAIAAVTIVFLFWPSPEPTAARSLVHSLGDQHAIGPMIIDGDFGHEWQYESPVPIRRFSQELSAEAEAKASFFVCTKQAGACDDDVDTEYWEKLSGTPVETWVRKNLGL